MLLGRRAFPVGPGMEMDLPQENKICNTDIETDDAVLAYSVKCGSDFIR